MKRFKFFQCAGVGIGLCAMLLVSELAGCSSHSSGNYSAKQYKEFLTVDVFDSQANYQGIQGGWFAKVVKDRFNMELNIISPNVSDNGDVMYQSRYANGNIGDLIITNADSGRLHDLVSAGLVLDMSSYIDGHANLEKYEDAIADMKKVAEAEGIYAIPSEISSQPPTEPCDISEPTNAPSVRWDIYEKIGCPEMETLEDLLDVMEEMQKEARKSDPDTYAFSLFKDWDAEIMQNACGLCALYGYEPHGFCMAKDDCTQIQSVTDADGIYIRALRFFYEANQRGLIDPESKNQTFDDLAKKYQEGHVLYSLWPWLGSGQYNNAKNTAEGKGFATAVINDMKCVTYGSMPKGKVSTAIMVGSKTRDPQRMVDFIDWLYSSEGIEMAAAESGGTCGPKGLTWDIDADGNPYLTDFGEKAFIDREKNLEVPEEWGGGNWIGGVSTLNYKTVGIADIDDTTGICYNYQKWDDYQEKTKTKLSQSWSQKNDDAQTALQYLEEKNMLLVRPGSNYATPKYSSDIQLLKDYCKQEIIADSWDMIYAEDDAEFYGILQKMQDTVKGLGYDEVFRIDQRDSQAQFDTFKETIREMKENVK